MYANATHNIYAQNNVGVESPTKLIEMLYEGVLRFNTQAKHAIKNDDIEKRVYWINRSTAVVAELMNILDPSGGEVSEYLDGLYQHQLSSLSKANMHNDPAILDEVNGVFKGLIQAWQESTAKTF
ncbi:flagellar export chaperone FliS [Sulfurimonas sp. MAG313]|nr:flagellar export chaperone FliS [Sulfurimonas sp. MAG313]MDF1881314.1 flagellar export chaperone FliS [Sulfurimonas sp. MAG313]